MHHFKTGKGALKDYNLWISDELNDYAELPQDPDPISHILKSNPPTLRNFPKKKEYTNYSQKVTSKWPKYRPEFDFKTASGGIFDGILGEKLAKYLKLSDIARLLGTCRYLNQIFSRSSIWLAMKIQSVHYMPDVALASVNVRQMYRFNQLSQSNGVQFDTIQLAKDLSKAEDKLLVGSVVDFVKISSQKTIETTYLVSSLGTLTEDLKISWIKEENKICLWIAGFQVRNQNIVPFACRIFTRQYQEIITDVFFLNDRYFVVELEGEENSKTFEIFVVEPEHNWFEKKEIQLCKQIVKETVIGKGEAKTKIKNIGDFFIFITGVNNEVLIKVFDLKEGKVFYESTGLHLESGLYDALIPKTKREDLKEGSFTLYILDQELEVYILKFNIESGIIINKVQIQIEKELQAAEKKDSEVQQLKSRRFPNNMKKYHHGISHQKDQSQSLDEYLILYKQKKLYLVKFNDNLEVVSLDLPGYADIQSQLANWTVCEDYIYLVENLRIHIYKINWISNSVFPHKIEVLSSQKVRNENEARWILVNPWLTIIVSAGRQIDSVQVIIGSTQRLLVRRSLCDLAWKFHDFWFDNMLKRVYQWQNMLEIEQEKLECKLENDRLLITSGIRSYFRDFNVCPKNVCPDKYYWKSQGIYDLEKFDMKAMIGNENQKNQEKQNSIAFEKLSENKNHHEKFKKQGCKKNWKGVEKKMVTEEKDERKENKKKGEKYFKNVRQGRHLQKICD